MSNWVYDLVRANVKRGRFFELDDVLRTGRADCLGYARLLSVVGPLFGVDFGVVEVIVDNAGRYVPHHVSLVNLSDGTRRFIDPWYGSTDIVHRRLGALADGKLRDLDSEELDGVRQLRGLPNRCVEAIVLYIRGNRLLDRDELDGAIELYSEAIRLYPNNTRAHYNRALARDRKGDAEAAQLDYAEALKDERGLARVLATVDELERLIELDDNGIDEKAQGIFLWNKGFRTGEPAGYEEIAAAHGMSANQVGRVVSAVERVCTL